MLQIKKDQSFIHELENHLDNNGPFSSFKALSLAYETERAKRISAFSGLKSLEYLPDMQFLPHQLQAARRVIEKMNGRAILADEVGLGKTIEAALILKEYMARGLVKRALILVPASLINQWISELNQKFHIKATVYNKNYSWNEQAVIISSLDMAKREPHNQAILDQTYDLLLIDEAHKLKNEKTKNHQFVRQINKKYCLLLTATPLQNNLREIFNLISILKPGHLGDAKSFHERFGTEKTTTKENDYLKQLVEHVMIRNKREDTSLKGTNRKINTIWIDFSQEEQAVYDELTELAFPNSSFTKITLLREFCSSREACFLSLEKLVKETPNQAVSSIIEKIAQLPHHKKANQVIELIQSLGNEKVILFTEYRATEFYLQWMLQQHGITSVPYHGGFKRSKKDWMIENFKNNAQVLIATEAGSEGINLQFSQHLINYDLPWNPMKLEQRIGRIHRYGQKSDVHIYNFAMKGTLEENIVQLLIEKIQLFENIIGELDAILSDLNIKDMEKEIETIYAESDSHDIAVLKLNHLASLINNQIDEKRKQGGS